MRISFLIPLVLLGLAGCVTTVHEPSEPNRRDGRDAGSGADGDLCGAGCAHHHD